MNINPSNAFAVKVKANWSNYVANFNYTGNAQTWTAPEDGYYKIELWGAQGGYVNNTSAYKVSYAGYTSGEIKNSKGAKLYIYIGQKGISLKDTGATSSSYGFNGGGFIVNAYTDCNYRGGANNGGGATDVRIVNGAWNDISSLRSRIMVAAGSGAVSSDTNSVWTEGTIGNAGGLIGYVGSNSDGRANASSSTGGTQISGGIYTIASVHESTSEFIGSNGGFGYGGSGVGRECFGAGGGSGWYGGGGSDDIASGSGGSSYISGHAGSIAVKSSSDTTPKCAEGSTSIDCSKSWTGYVFTNTKMIDGAGYNWTTVKGNYVGQPQPDGSTAAGHSGNGYARITYLGSTL